MKNSQVSALVFMLVLLFSAGKEVVATETGHTCTEEIKLPSWKIPDCSSLCKTRHGDEATGVYFRGGCLCSYPCLSS
ncbi:hypothetical protein E1A91_D13G189700v1 [Gossypium mustelinum]|nr:hypothetical protein ES319_D13G185800v1 [Gossypium barbadense]TYG38135.1 hypothetical protein ES288_D13G197200v1 [Gossypium darwinii]TYH35527.1 hypothetical protein ES332_D13G198900v1 [Gossypium tomentosum]TYI47664.1 hypothetical protein E1A91_D13G189700v1 [Gossypium mustelinum]